MWAAIAGYEYAFSFVNTGATGNVTIIPNTINGLNGISFISGSSTSFQYSMQQVAFTQSTLTVGDRAFFRCDGTSWTAEVYTLNGCQTWS